MTRRFFWTAVLSLLATTSASALPWTLSGQVSNEMGNALSGARVELAPMVRNHDWMEGAFCGRLEAKVVAATRTDDTGRFFLNVPATGVWSLVVKAPGAVPMRYAPLPLASHLELPPVTLLRDVGAKIEVVDPQGNPMPGLMALAVAGSELLWKNSTRGGWRVGARVGSSDRRGAVTLPRAAGELLRVCSVAPGRLEVRCVEGALRMTLTIPTQGGSVRTLEVSDRFGKPLANIMVGLGEMVLPVGQTNIAGRLKLASHDVERIEIHLMSNTGGRGRYEVETTGTGTISLRLEAPAQAVGEVISSLDHQAVPGVLVWPPHDPGRFSVTGEGGSYDVIGSSEPVFWARFIAEGYRPLAQRLDGALERRQRILLDPARPAVGRVLDSEGRPLAGVEVELARAEGGTSGVKPVQASTDASGQFRIEMVPAERLDIRIRKAGYAPTLVRDVAVAPGLKPVDLGTLWLMPAVTLEGRVEDSLGRAIPEVAVWKIVKEQGRVDELRQESAAITGPAGRFSLGNLERGSRIDLWVQRSGYLPRRFLGVEVPTARPLLVVLQAAAEVRGRAVDREGTPLVGVQVELRDPPPPAGTVGVERRRGAGSRLVVSDAEGRFVISDVAPGRAEIESSLDGYESAPPKRFDISPGEIVEEVTLVLRQGAVLEGRVVNEEGEAVAGARLRLGKQEKSSDATGYFRLAGLAPGRHVLVGRHLEFDRHVREILVEPGENQTEVVFEGGWPVAGWVVGEDGSPVSGAQVGFRLGRGSGEVRHYQARSGVQGRFEVRRMVNGLYDLEVEAEGYGPLVHKGGLRVEGQVLSDVEIKLSPGVRLVGTVFGLEFEELAQVHVEATQGGEVRRAGRVDFEGSYEIADLGAGVWFVRAFTPGGIRQAEARVTLGGGQRQVVQDLEFHGLTLRGAVTYEDAPLPDSAVSLTGHEVAIRRKVTTDYQGHFRLTDLPPGRYRLAVANGLHTLTHHQDFELLDDLELPIEIATARVEGVVVSSSEEHPIDDALMYVEQLLGDGSARPAALTTVATNSHGSFTLARLSAGRYRLTARKDGYIPRAEVLDLEPGVARKIRLTLKATEGLELSLRLPPGVRPLFAQISVLDPAGRLVLSDTRRLDEQGAVRFPTVPAGIWQVVVGAPGLAVTRLEVTLPGPPIELVLPVAAQLELRVPSLVEANLMGEFALFGVDGHSFLGHGPDGTLNRQWPLRGGVGRLGGLPEGVWALSVQAVDGQAWQETVTVFSGQEVEVVLE